ncbi:uncharacterized protein LOC129719822 [Wyeomyia smithii]|uniref:uncharacterized protein LOC129719822 n=1 Tax=Wyeomyia smithii TaxID=174621 RepID=UPI002467E2DE|nr:uncharacterized protein LOC129719822 [Wyeomyia smithii]
MAKKLERLLDLRDMAKEKMCRIREGLKQAEVSIHWLNLQLDTLRRCNDDMQKTYWEICDIVPRDQREEHKNEYIRAEELYTELTVQIQTEVTKWNASEAEKVQGKINALAPAFVPQQPAVVSNSTPHLQFPLPTFDGSLENWYSFKCMFKTIMNRYPNESPAIKLYHLKNSLVGNAAGKIDQDVINNNDYESAWKMLENTYEDERFMIDTHIDALLNLPKMTSENGNELRNLLDTCTKHVDALKNRQLVVDGLSEMILVNLIAKRLDKETRKLWKSQIPGDELPAYSDLIDYLRERSRILQKMKEYTESRPTNAPKQKVKFEQKTTQGRNFVQTSSKQSKESCICCNGDHQIYKCDTFRELTVNDRYNKVRQAGLGFNCLRRGHRSAACNSDNTCRTCKRKHHSLLHDDKPAAPKVKESTPATSSSTTVEEQRIIAVQTQGSVNCTKSFMLEQQVLLSTAEVHVQGSSNKNVLCRALLDSGSDSNLICESLARKLNVAMENVNIPISGVDNAETAVKYRLRTKISSRVNSFNALLDFLVVPTITTNLPIVKVDIRCWTIPANLSLADPAFHIPNEIEMIIGAELLFELLQGGRIKLASGAPMLVETQLGWIVSGTARLHKSNSTKSVCHLNRVDEQLNLLTADIPKMYRQVQVHKDDRKYQRILWLNANNDVGAFELTTVTYGCASAPYLATRTLMQLAKDEAHELPLAA